MSPIVDTSVPIPRLMDYDISPVTGFLPTTEPLRRLPNTYYKPWEDVVENLNALLLVGQLRPSVIALPLLDHTQLETRLELQRAFLILSMMAHAYIWGKAKPVTEILPATLAVPWHNIAKRIGLCPVVCHAAVCLWNWRLIDPKKGRDLSNLACLHTYSGSTDEAWFYLVTTAIEAEGARALPLIISALEASRSGDLTAAADALKRMETVLEDINNVLKRMYDHCDPYIFYWRVRPYLAGWENMADGGLPNGVIYEGLEDEDGKGTTTKYRKFAGGSAAQSSLIHALDIALGVEHRPTGPRRDGTSEQTIENGKTQSTPNTPPTTAKPAAGQNNFILKMRDYMPEPHRNFLEHLQRAATLRPFVQKVAKPLSTDPNATEHERSEAKRLVEMYDACLNQIKLFRDKHVQIVTIYIVMQARRGPSIGTALVVPPGAPAAGTHATFHREKVVSTVTDEEIRPQNNNKQNGEQQHHENNSSLAPQLSSSSSGGGGGGTFVSKCTTTIAETTTIDTPESATANWRESLRRPSLPSVAVPPDSNSTLVDENESPSSPTFSDYSTTSSTDSNVTAKTAVTVSSDASGIVRRHTIGLAKQSVEGSVVVRGTGGSNVLPFLKQARDEVVEARLGSV